MIPSGTEKPQARASSARQNCWDSAPHAQPGSPLFRSTGPSTLRSVPAEMTRRRSGAPHRFRSLGNGHRRRPRSSVLSLCCPGSLGDLRASELTSRSSPASASATNSGSVSTSSAPEEQFDLSRTPRCRSSPAQVLAPSPTSRPGPDRPLRGTHPAGRPPCCSTTTCGTCPRNCAGPASHPNCTSDREGRSPGLA